ncbi:MAG: helix-turn-helix transcriptional regulator [Actinobacteria bacterium]|nr:MAG: helix-turn-helix transcriptional regulator [Actinomycetota bacterium]
MGTDAAATHPRGRPRDEHTDDAILAATLRLLRGRGYRLLSVEGVAAEARVAKTTIYRRYRNKADLATAALATMVPVDQLARPSDDPRRDLAVGGRGRGRVPRAAPSTHHPPSPAA